MASQNQSPNELRQTLSEIEGIVEQLKQKFHDCPEEMLGNPSPEVREQLDQAIALSSALDQAIALSSALPVVDPALLKP